MVNGVRGSGQIIGEVHNQSDKTLTVKLADGSSKIILLGSSTLLIKSESFSLADIFCRYQSENFWADQSRWLGYRAKHPDRSTDQSGYPQRFAK